MAIERNMMRQAHRDRTTYRKLTEAGVKEIFRLRDLGWTIQAISDDISKRSGRQIARSTVGDVLKRQNWADVQWDR